MIRSLSHLAGACTAGLLLLLPGSVGAQGTDSATGRSTIFIPLSLQVGLPQGEFAENVDIAGGINGGLIWAFAGPLAFRADLGIMAYGSETRRVPLGDGPLGRITVDVTTTNTIFNGGLGLQLGVPGPRTRPYVGGMIGVSSFNTSSSVRGTNSSDESFASSENYSDAAFAKTAFTGLYIPFANRRTMFDMGVRYTWNGEEVRYLTEGDIVDNPTGPPTITPRRTRADLLTVTLGVTISTGGRR